MAKEEHLAVLKQGVNTWNNWRKENPGICPVLSNVNLSQVNLCGADLSWANFRGTNLSEANLSRANLSRANLGGANLYGGNLQGAIYTSETQFPKGFDPTEAGMISLNEIRVGAPSRLLRAPSKTQFKLTEASTLDVRLGAPLPPTAPPPTAVRKVAFFVLVIIGILVGIAYQTSKRQNATSFLFASQMLLFTVAVCLTPTIAQGLTKQQGRIVRVAVETLLFVALLLGFSLWLFGTSAFGIWIGYASVLIFLLEAGSNIVERHKVITLKHLSRSALFESLRNNAEAIEKMFYNELVLYISVPVGLVIGTAIGLIRHQTQKQIIVSCLQLVFLLASLVLLFFLIQAFARMSDPLFKTNQISSPEITNEPIEERIGFIHRISKVLRLNVPPPKNEMEDQEQQDINLACMSSDLRKIYLYDAVHNVTLIVAFVAFFLSLLGVIIDIKWLIGSLIGVALIFNQLPYVIGQSLLYEKIAERYEGVKREEINEKLKKYAPLFPKFEFFASLSTTGTAGGLVYFLLDQFMKNILK